MVLVRPEQNPWQRLAAGLLNAQHGTESLTLVLESRDDVDREVERLRGEGLGPVARLLRSKDRPLLVITLRADYLLALLAIPGIGPCLDQRLYLLSPLTDEELRAAVECSANVRGVEFDTGLVDQIVCDTGVKSLPLLQFTLHRLWNTQRHRTLTSTCYRAIGCVSGVLDHFADRQISKLADGGDGVVDRLLLRLVHTPAADPDLTTRRRAYQSEPPLPEWEAAWHLADAWLIIVDIDHNRGPYVELAHEALIRPWQRLHRLVWDNADFLGWLAWIQQCAAGGDPLPRRGCVS